MDVDYRLLWALLASYGLPNNACAAFSGDIKCRNEALMEGLLCARHCVFGEEPRLPPMLHNGRIVEELMFYTPRQILVPAHTTPKRMAMQRCCAVVYMDTMGRPAQRCENVGLCWPYCPTHMVLKKRLLMDYHADSATFIGLYAVSIEAPNKAVVFANKHEVATTVERNVCFPDANTQPTTMQGRYDLFCAENDYPLAYLQRMFNKGPMPFTWRTANHVCDMTFRRANLMMALVSTHPANVTMTVDTNGMGILTSTRAIRNGEAIALSGTDMLTYTPRFLDVRRSFYDLGHNVVLGLKAVFAANSALRMAMLPHMPVVRSGQAWMLLLANVLAETRTFNLYGFFAHAWKHGETLRDAWKLFTKRSRTVHVLAMRARTAPDGIPGRAVVVKREPRDVSDMDAADALGCKPTSQLYLMFMAMLAVVSPDMSSDEVVTSTLSVVASILPLFQSDGAWVMTDAVRGHALLTTLLLREQADFPVMVDKKEQLVNLKRIVFGLTHDPVFQVLRSRKQQGELPAVSLKHELMYNAMVNAINETLVCWNINGNTDLSAKTVNAIEKKYVSYLFSLFK